MTYKLTLASTSSSRRQLLQQIGLTFDCCSPDADETVIASETHRQRALRLSHLKATSITPMQPDHWILGSDQVASCDGQLLRKPLSKENALRQLQLSRGKWVNFYTAFTLHSQQTTFSELIEARLRFRADSTDAELMRYIDIDEPIYCAGSFKTESLGPLLFDEINASDPTSIQGLPLIAVARALRQLGINPLNDAQA